MNVRWFWLVIFILTAWTVHLLSPILTPFIVAILFAYIGDPLVDRLEKRFSRTFGVITVFLSIFATVLIVLVFLLPLLEQQISLFFNKLPEYLSILYQLITPILKEYFGVELEKLDMNMFKQWLQNQYQQDSGAFSSLIGLISNSGLTLLNWMMNIILIPVVTFYMLRDWDIFIAHIHKLIPRRYEAVSSKLALDSDEVIGAFFRGQLMVMLALGVIYTIGLWMVGLELALLLGMTAGLVSFVPYLGFIVGVVSAGIAALIQFQEIMPLIYVLGVFAVGQLLEGMVLSPVLLGERIGLHPVAVIFAVMAGGQLFGFFGVLVALPVAAVIKVLLHHLHGHYLQSRLYANSE
jgi:predicted PurR-regulated permease PerM